LSPNCLVWGSRNPAKGAEAARIMAPLLPGLLLVPAEASPPEEDRQTYAGNALLKSRAASSGSRPALADDSGLEASALGGAPGVRSARYGPDDRARNLRLLGELRGAGDRSARFVAAVALVLPDGGRFVVESRCPGVLEEAPRGEGGFGYDPLFRPRGETRVFAEMREDEKNRLSHRGQALSGMAQILRLVLEYPLGIPGSNGGGAEVSHAHGGCPV